MNNWKTGNEVGSIYLLSERDLDRIGGGWMSDRLFCGDICLCIEHTGDCFYDYILLDVISNQVEGLPQSRFGAYCFAGAAFTWKPTMEEFHLLCAGKRLNSGLSKHALRAEIDEKHNH